MKKSRRKHRGYAAIDLEKFSARRRASGRTLKELAALLGVATSTVNAWELGKATPHPCHLKALFAVVGDDILVDGSVDMPPMGGGARTLSVRSHTRGRVSEPSTRGSRV